jgi:hypothetical protein
MMNFSRAWKISVFGLLLTVWQQTAFSWGPLGHRAICDATWRLSPPTLRQQLGTAAERMGYDTFAESCVWADDVRGQTSYQWLAPLHYVNVPASATRASEAECWSQPRHSEPTCVLQAIDFFTRRLGDSRLFQRQRDEALLLLGHFVGDVHQPLHVSYAEDRGGTRTQVIFKGERLSLHRFWDTTILYCETHEHWRQLGRRLYQQARKQRGETGQPLAWADESLALTRSIYGRQHRHIDDDYCHQYSPLVQERLVLAALRLQKLIAARL